MQGTVKTFDADTGSGSVMSDRGEVIDFPGAAFARSGLRLLRPGQRVTVCHDETGVVELVTIVGFEAAEPGARPPT